MNAHSPRHACRTKRISSLLLFLSGAALSWGASPPLEGRRQLVAAADGANAAGDDQAALAALKQALRIVPEELPAAIMLARLASVEWHQGQMRKAESDYLRSLALWQKASPDDPQQTGVMVDLVGVYGQTGRWTKAEQYGRRAMALHEGFEEMQSLAAVLQGEHRYVEALELYQRAFQLKDPVRDVTRLARAHSNLGVLLNKMGQRPRAIEEVRRAIAWWDLEPAADRLQLAVGLTNLADLYCREGRPADAEEPIRRAREIVTAESDARQPVLYSILRAQAQVLRRTGKAREARDADQEARELLLYLAREDAGEYTVDVNSLR